MVAASTVLFEQLPSWDEKRLDQCDQGEKSTGAGHDAGQCHARAQALFMVIERLFDLGMRFAVLGLGSFYQGKTFVKAIPEFRYGRGWVIVCHKVFYPYAAHEIDTGRLKNKARESKAFPCLFIL